MDKYDNTILIITSDHAEEFADTSPTRFGHGSNYTKYQTQVPLVVHWPGKQAKEFKHRTASIDVAATLIDEVAINGRVVTHFVPTPTNTYDLGLNTLSNSLSFDSNSSSL